MRVLVCWIGSTDLSAAGIRTSKRKEDPGVGPIGQALDKREFDKVVLLSNYPRKEGSDYISWAQQRTSAKVTLHQVELDDPTDFAAIYKLADEALRELSVAAARDGEVLELTLHASPGTPMMSAAWIILGKAKYPAELIQTSRQRGLVTTAVPLDIVVEFLDLIPQLLKRPDAALEARSEGAPPEAPKFGNIVYRCNAMAELISRARRLTHRSVSVLVEGESGTGKELLARAIHEEGTRRGKPFIALNCGAMPKDLVESLLFGHTKGAFTGAMKTSPGYFRAARRKLRTARYWLLLRSVNSVMLCTATWKRTTLRTRRARARLGQVAGDHAGRQPRRRAGERCDRAGDSVGGGGAARHPRGAGGVEGDWHSTLTQCQHAVAGYFFVSPRTMSVPLGS